MKIFKKSLTILLLASCFFFFPSPIQAQQMNLSISPPLLEVTIKPGKTITQVFNIKNNGEDIQLYSQIIPFYPKGKQGKIQLDQNFLNPFTNPSKTGKYQYLNWFSLQNAGLELGDSFTIKEGEKQQLVLKIRVPETAEQKDYWTALALRTTPTIDLNKQQVSASGILTSNILLTVSETKDWPKKGTAEINLANKLCLLKNNLCLPVVDSFQQPRFAVTVQNQTNHFYKPEGTITVKNLFNKEIDTIKILPNNVLSQTQRNLECQKNQETAPCRTRPLNFGFYKASLEIDLVPTNTFTASFFVLPYKLGLALGIMIIILIYLRKKLALDKD
jgi:hypothetical protein